MTGDLHGGTHVHSPWKFVDLGKTRTLKANFSLETIVNHPGDYFVIGTAQLYTGYNGTAEYRWDMANALVSFEGRYVHYQNPAEIREVSDGVKYGSFVVIGIASSIILYFTTQIIRHRNHQVLQLSQGEFLIVFSFTALAATICCFLLDPKNDTYCRIRYPLILIPIQVMYSISVGRMWRIHAVISPLLLEHLNKGEPSLAEQFIQAITYISFTLDNLTKPGKDRADPCRTIGGLKQQISKSQLALVVLLFASPQVILQTIALVLQPSKLVVEFNADESIGRATCDSRVSVAEDLTMYSFILLLMLIVVLLVMAHSCRKLPSLFNETRTIYDSTFLSVVLLLLGAAVIALTNTPEMNPDVEYLVLLFLILSITINPTVRILLPKLKMVWKNETVVVSKLVTDHHRKAREKRVLRGTATAKPHISGIGAPHTRGSGSRFQQNNPMDEGSTNGDYDPSQIQSFLTTHSDSNDTSLIGGRSSLLRSNDKSSMASNGDDSVNVDSQEHDGSEQIESDEVFPDECKSHGTNRQQLQVVLEEQGQIKTHEDAEVDVETGNGGSQTLECPDSSPEKSSEGLEGYTGRLTDDDSSGELMDAAIPEMPETNKTIDDKKVSFLERRTYGFLKGMSWRGGSNRSIGDGQRSPRGSQAVGSGNHDISASNKKRENTHIGKSKRLSQRIVVSEEETPARRLVLKMLDLQDQLEAVSNKIMSGVAVTQKDWDVVTKLTANLEHTFSNDVKFEWDVARECEERLKHTLPSDMGGSKDFSRELADANSNDDSEGGLDVDMGPFDAKLDNNEDTLVPTKDDGGEKKFNNEYQERKH